MAEAKIPLTKEERKTKCEEFLKLSDIRQEWFNFIIEDSDLCKSLCEAYTEFKPYYSEGEERIIPREKNILAALRYNAPADVKVIILGQDPVRDSDMATGLAFSFWFYKTESTLHCGGNKSGRSVLEVHHALRKAGIEPGESLCHEHWAFRGVLLFNVCPTVDPVTPKDKPNPHFEHWRPFTTLLLDMVLEIEGQKPKIVLCWGKHATEVGQRLGRVSKKKYCLIGCQELQDNPTESAKKYDLIFDYGCHPASRNPPFHVQASKGFQTIEEIYPGLFTNQDEYEAICRQTILHNKTALMYHCRALSHYLLVAHCRKDMDTFYGKTPCKRENTDEFIQFHRDAKEFHQGAMKHHEKANDFAITDGLKEYHKHAATYHKEEAKYHSEEAKKQSEETTTLPLQTTDTHRLYQALDHFLKESKRILDTKYQSGIPSQADDRMQDGIRSRSSYHRRAADFNSNATDFHKQAKQFHLDATRFHQKFLLPKPLNDTDLDLGYMCREYACEYHDNEINYHQEAAEYHRHISNYYQNTERYHHNAAIYHGKVGVTNNDDSVLTDIENFSIDANPSASS